MEEPADALGFWELITVRDNLEYAGDMNLGVLGDANRVHSDELDHPEC